MLHVASNAIEAHRRRSEVIAALQPRVTSPDVRSVSHSAGPCLVMTSLASKARDMRTRMASYAATAFGFIGMTGDEFARHHRDAQRAQEAATNFKPREGQKCDGSDRNGESQPSICRLRVEVSPGKLGRSPR